MNSHTCVNGGTCNPYAYYGLTGTPDGNRHNEWRATNPDWLISDGEWPEVKKWRGDYFCKRNYCVHKKQDSIMVHNSGVEFEDFDCYTPPEPWDPEQADPHCKECCERYLDCDSDEAYDDCLLECNERWLMCDFLADANTLEACHIDGCAGAHEVVLMQDFMQGESTCNPPVGFAPPSETSEPTMAPVEHQVCEYVNQSSDFGKVVVDGNIDEWNLSDDGPDFVANMHEAGKTDKMIGAKLYARLECATGKMCIMVNAVNDAGFQDSDDDTWFKNYGTGNMDPQLPINDGNEIVKMYENGKFMAWEACYFVPPGNMNNFEIHTNFCKSDGTCGNTASTGKKGASMCIACGCGPNSTPAPVPVAATDDPTASPTKSPTKAPTGSPTKSPTKAPTGSPTGSPVTPATPAPVGLAPPVPTSFAPTPCYPEEAIFVAERLGVAEGINLPDDAVQIAKNDGDSVTIRVSQVWVEGKMRMLSVRYRDETETSVCDKNINVDADTTEEFTATCVEKTARVSVYITKGASQAFNPTECDGCESPDADTDSFLGAYHLEIDCDPEPCAEPEDPTSAPIDFPPIEGCPNEVDMITIPKNLPNGESPIKIVARTDETVTFQVHNTFNNELDHVFIEHYDTDRNVPCAHQVDFGKDQVATYTALCAHTTSKTTVNMWVADSSVPGGNNAKVPDCCEGSANFPKVAHYTFELICDCDHEFVCDHFCPPELTA